MTLQSVKGRSFALVTLGLDLPARANTHASPRTRQGQ